MKKADMKTHHLTACMRSLALIICLLFPAHVALAATVDIMYVYDSGSTTWVASNGGMEVFSQQITTRMNQALANSGVGLTLRFVHAMPVAYSTSTLDNSNALTALQQGDGVFEAVHEARDDHGADLVAMLCQPTSSSSTAGWAYTLSSWSGRPAFGFSINDIRWANTHYTLAHEVGHNFGAHHAISQTSGPGPNISLTNPSAPYSAGWYFTGTNLTKYHTIMAYWFDGLGNTYTQAPLFSSPLLTYQGTAAGHAQDGDNARLLRETMSTVAAYRATVDPRTLTVDIAGAQNVTISSAPAGYGGTPPYDVAGIAPGTALTLTAPQDAPNAVFDSWTGCDSVSGRECSVTMNADRTVRVNYAVIPRTLSVGVSGVQAALVASSPEGYGGSAPYEIDDIPQGTAVTLTVPATVDGVPFQSWTGCDATLNATCSLVMDGDRSVQAVYARPGAVPIPQEVLYLLLLFED